MDTALVSHDTFPTTDMRLTVIKAPKPVIPTEVIEQIIDMVAELGYRFDRVELGERTHTLHSCALTSRLWVPRSRLHLFRSVELGSECRTRRFFNSLSLSPALGRYVRILQIQPYKDDERSCGWIYKALSTLPPLLPHLRELAFDRLPDLHPACVAVLSRFRTVESLVLHGLEKQSLREIVQLISRLPQLRWLDVQDCEWKLPGRYYSGKQHKLATLNVDTDSSNCDRSLLEWAVASKSNCTLTTFRADSDVTGSAMERVLQTCYPTLRELHLNLRSENVTPLTNHLALQRLTLHGSIGNVISTLARLPLFAPSFLVGIRIDPWYTPVVKPFEEIPESQWKAIDLALCDSKFPHLSSVEFTETMEEPFENPHAFFHGLLPSSYERGILWLRRDDRGQPTRIAPVGAPQYPGLPLKWEEFY